MLKGGPLHLKMIRGMISPGLRGQVRCAFFHSRGFPGGGPPARVFEFSAEVLEVLER